MYIISTIILIKMIPPHMIPVFALIGCCVITMLTLSVGLVAVSTNEDVLKALEELENEQNNDPSSSPSSSSTPGPGPPAFQYPIGTTVMCEENDKYGENEKNRYRVSSNQGKLRYYPDDDIAKSWDGDWEYEEYIEDCDGLALGDPMAEKPPVGTSVKCGKNDLKDSNNISVYRVNEDATLGHYPNSTIAASWDSDWEDNTTIENCEGIIFHGNLESNGAATNTASSTPVEYHCVQHEDAKANYISNTNAPDPEAKWNEWYERLMLNCTIQNNPDWITTDDERKSSCENSDVSLTNGKVKLCQWKSTIFPIKLQ